MGARSYDERLSELYAKKERSKKKVDQLNEQIKRLEKIAAEDARKQRTHALIVCGAELAALFEKVLDQEEIYTVVNFLRKQKELGFFTLEKNEEAAQKKTEASKQEENGIDEEIFGDFFDF